MMRQTKLADSIRKARGQMEPEHIVELISFLSLAAQKDPQGFEDALQLENPSEQYEALAALGTAIGNQHGWPPAICQAPELSKLNTTILSDIASQIQQLDDWSAFTHILQEMTREMGKKGWIFGVNKTTAAIFAALVGDCRDKTIYDGSCGLARIASELNAKYAVLEEINPTTWVVAFRLLLLEGKSFELLNRDALTTTSTGSQADVVTMEPPLGMRFPADQRRTLAHVDYLQVPCGEAFPASAGDVLWIQKALSMLNSQGRAYILLPHGWLFRGGYESMVRQYLLEQGLIEAIIGLPAGILDFTGIPTVLVIFKKGRAARSPIAFIDVHDIGKLTRIRKELSKADVQLITELVAGKHPEDPRYKVVEIAEINAQENNLNISLYIRQEAKVEVLSVKDELAKRDQLQKEYDIARSKLNDLLGQFRHK